MIFGWLDAEKAWERLFDFKKDLFVLESTKCEWFEG